MSKGLNQDNAYIFRIVHTGNIDGVLAKGCRCQTATTEQGYVEIGNHELIAKRNARAVPIPPGGTLSDYVPFYFTPYTPMMLNIKTGRNVPKKPLSEIAILVSSVPHLVQRKLPFVFTDRHAYLTTAQFSSDPADLSWIIWPEIQARNFKKDEIDRFEKYQAETLVHKHVPLDALLGIICYNEAARLAVETKAKAAGAKIKIVADAKCFL